MVGLNELESTIESALERICQDLKASKGGNCNWTGQLSASALSTATAVSALSVCRNQLRTASVEAKLDYLDVDKYGPNVWDTLIEQGSRWLSGAQNSDGGFGDTDRSLSNIATTLLVLAAWQLAGHNARNADRIEKAWAYVERKGSWDGLRQRYGKDKTFVVPIMTNCAIAGLFDWSKIPTLPFEAAWLPQSWYRFVQLPVVSYAIPALVAIGQAQFHHAPPRNPVLRGLRTIAQEPTRRVLTQMQPTSGGYLEAVPLTSFVLMSLASSNQSQHRVAMDCRRFIVDSVLSDGSWPIDTNLATWVTSLAAANYYRVTADSSADSRVLSNQAATQSVLSEWSRTVDWQLSCQHNQRHPFTGANPGGWGWTNLSGAVPDADDTPAALLSLHEWLQTQSELHSSLISEQRQERVKAAAMSGCKWLLGLQNRDGGWPTFCRGWGTLPFDRSGNDLTAHAVRALSVWRDHYPKSTQLDQAVRRGWQYLERKQQKDGSWLPLWFGNQDRPDEDNPWYGTGKVMVAYSQTGNTNSEAYRRGLRYLVETQNADGGWGGGASIAYPEANNPIPMPSTRSQTSTIEETAVVLEGLLHDQMEPNVRDSSVRGFQWLCEAILESKHQTSQPIGFYFARLWYYERLYPLVFSLSALRKGLAFCQR